MSRTGMCRWWAATILILAGLLGSGSVEAASRPKASPPPNPTPGNAASKTTGHAEVDAILAASFSRRPADVMAALAKPEPGADAPPVDRLRRAVIERDWKAVGAVLDALPSEHRTAVYDHLLDELKFPTFNKPDLIGETALDVADLIALTRLAPADASPSSISQITQRFSEWRNHGGALDGLSAELEKGLGPLGGTDPKARLAAAQFLLSMGQLAEAAAFLPPYDEAVAQKDEKLLQMVVSVETAQSYRGDEAERKTHRDRAWETLMLLANGADFSESARQQAVQQAVSMGSGRREPNEAAQQWLREQFLKDSGAGADILNRYSQQVQRTERDKQEQTRLSMLRQQAQLLNTLMESSALIEGRWRQPLDLAAAQWLQEARHTQANYVKPPEQDQQPRYYGYPYPPPQPQAAPVDKEQEEKKLPAIAPEQLLEIAPSSVWLERLPPDAAARVNLAILELSLKAEKPEPAYDALQRLAARSPELAGNYVGRYLNLWAADKDPNRQNNRRSYYGGNGDVNRIPLTRAMQAQNVRELRQKADELKGLGIKIGDYEIPNAFDRIRSNAEVYQLDELESLFGPLKDWNSASIGNVAGRLRSNLAGKWRRRDTQDQAKTKRTDAMLQAEIKRGYALLYQILDAGLAQQDSKDDTRWELLLLKAQTEFDEAEYLYGINEDLATYTAARERAFTAYAEAEKAYAASLKDKAPVRIGYGNVYHAWFNAAMGASDIGYLSRQQDPDRTEIAKIAAALRALPKEQSEAHLDGLAALIGSPRGGITPELKARYVRYGLEVVGDRPKAEDARKLLAFYDSLLGEVSLHAALDGSGIVGHGQPFGLLLSLHHTETLGREAGGFSRYLQNQQQSSGYSYNPGGPRGQQDYRDALDKKIREAFADGFQVDSITYFDPGTEPRALPQEGWREKPLAYVLLRATDAARDKVPPVQMDLDFVDRTGPVVLPVETAPLLVDARPESVPPRPVRHAKVDMALDDRRIGEGYVNLEITATGEGVLPPLDALLDLGSLGLEIAQTDDQGLSVSSLQTEGEGFTAVTEHNWLLKLVPAEGGKRITSFTFPKVKLDGAEVNYQRYNDADMEKVDPQVALAGFPLARGNGAYLWLLLVLALAVGGYAWWRSQQKQATSARPVHHWQIPDHPTVFGTLTLLRRILNHRPSPLTADQENDLRNDIKGLESRYFSPDTPTVPTSEPTQELRTILSKWTQVANASESSVGTHDLQQEASVS